MGTPKRERQKANRQQRLIEEAKAERADVVRRNTLRWGLGIVAAIGAVLGIAWIGGAFDGDGDEDVTPVTVPELLPTDPDTAEPATPAPEKPSVEIPEAEPTELSVTTLTAGDGPEAAEGDTVDVYYVGVVSEDGTEFDSNYETGTPLAVTIGDTPVIEGWTQGLIGARPGERRQLDIPGDLAYGPEGRGELIGPDTALTFVVDVMTVSSAS